MIQLKCNNILLIHQQFYIQFVIKYCICRARFNSFIFIYDKNIYTHYITHFSQYLRQFHLTLIFLLLFMIFFKKSKGLQLLGDVSQLIPHTGTVDLNVDDIWFFLRINSINIYILKFGPMSFKFKIF